MKSSGLDTPCEDRVCGNCKHWDMTESHAQVLGVMDDEGNPVFAVYRPCLLEIRVARKGEKIAFRDDKTGCGSWKTSFEPSDEYLAEMENLQKEITRKCA